MASSSFCLTCSSELALERSPWLTPCCSTPICSSCLSRNPRLKDYIPCLKCGDVKTLEGERAARSRRAMRDPRAQMEESDMFTIGDDEDDPPAYDDAPIDCQPERSAEPSGDHAHVGSLSEEEMETVEIRHPVSKSDTLLFIARRYAVDVSRRTAVVHPPIDTLSQPHEIVALNDLPPAVLSSQPHLLRTRQTLIISRRQIPKSKLANGGDPLVFDSGLGVAEQTEDDKRERERAVKRFQLLTKTIDPGVGQAYMGLSELEEEDGLLDESFEGENDAGGSGKKALREPANREDRALEAFYGDEQWEHEAGKPTRGQGVGRWKTIGNGSNLGIKV
ncbi:hypothetical protein BD324DRAFT_624277 [Kockovaella imperatae]|uniref:LysM domain-containing protein n=1 Tax=Kockovaella imperatae TaxID=4999 RepID=A0A1Y1UKG9_9TREE|nr:hypothetical protein BD324DRAFT_624277 [Kockovaella imperatae]ORX38037.1 hypothetical protein BD324DRAFT_624277 [Kockovaella imperatae]